MSEYHLIMEIVLSLDCVLRHNFPSLTVRSLQAALVFYDQGDEARYSKPKLLVSDGEQGRDGEAWETWVDGAPTFLLDVLALDERGHFLTACIPSYEAMATTEVICYDLHTRGADRALTRWRRDGTRLVKVEESDTSVLSEVLRLRIVIGSNSKLSLEFPDLPGRALLDAREEASAVAQDLRSALKSVRKTQSLLRRILGWRPKVRN